MMYIVGLHWILSEEPNTQTSPVPLIEDLLISEEYVAAENSKTWLRRNINLSPEKIVEAAGQRENSLWAAIKKLRFTASLDKLLVLQNAIGNLNPRL